MGDPLSATAAVLSLPGIFMSCVQCFELIQCGRNIEQDSLILTTRFSNQQLRFAKWGEACGFGSPSGYNKGLDDPVLRPHIDRTLRSIEVLLKSGVEVSKTYNEPAAKENAVVSNQSISTRWSWTTVKRRLRRSQDARGAKDVFKWAFTEKKKLDEIVRHLSDLIEDLEVITKDLGVPERQRILVHYEIQSISDAETLELMEASRLGSADIVSDTASVRLRSLHSADQLPQDRPGSILDVLSVPDTNVTAESYRTAPKVIHSAENTATAAEDPGDLRSEAQNSRIMTELLNNISPAPRMNSELKLDISTLGKLVDNLSLETFDQAIEDHPLFSEGSQGFLAGNRERRILDEFKRSQMGTKIKGSRWYNTHYVGTNLRYVLGSIEGPLNTPYEGGIFHLVFRISDSYPMLPPICRMITKIYHPNINPRGEVCVDMLGESWSSVMTLDWMLISIASLLDDPGLESPLVPEIAATYVKNPAFYKENARLYTQKYARELCPTQETTKRFIAMCEELDKEARKLQESDE